MFVRFALSFSTAHRMVDRVLDHTADMRTNAEPASSSRLAGYYVLMLFVSDLTDSRHALEKDQSQFAGGHTHKGVLAFLSHELRRRTGGAHKDAAASGLELHIVDDRTDGDVLKLKSVAGAYIGTFAGEDDVADVEADRRKDVSLLSVFVGDESDARGTVGIVLDSGDFAGHAELIALEIDYTILDSAASAAVAHGDAPVVVASR